MIATIILNSRGTVNETINKFTKLQTEYDDCNIEWPTCDDAITLVSFFYVEYIKGDQWTLEIENFWDNDILTESYVRVLIKETLGELFDPDSATVTIME